MTNSSFTIPRNGLTVRSSVSSRGLVCLLAMLVLGLGRPVFDLSLGLVSERETDPVEQEDSESEEELAIRCRGVFRRRGLEPATSATSHGVCRMAPREAFRRVAGLLDRPTPHDSDLRNGLGATLRC